jgi:hypothetical protein
MCAFLSKFSAPIPVLLIAMVLLFWCSAGIRRALCARRQFGRKLALGVLLSWPALLWLGRNWVIWGNPLYPQLERFLGRPGRLHELTLLAGQTASANLQAAWISPLAFLKNMALTFPCAPLAMVTAVRERRRPLTWILVAWGLVTMAFLFVTGARWLERYFYPGIGLYALYAALGALELWRRTSIGVVASGCPWSFLRRLYRPWAPLALVGALMAALLVALYVMHPVPYALRPHEQAVLGYLRAHAPGGYTASGGEPVILLVDAAIVTWYESATAEMVRPADADYSRDSVAVSLRQWRFHDLPFLLATDGQFDLKGDAAYFSGELARAGVSYVYSSPRRKTRPHFWQEVAGHPEFFEPVLEAYGAQLWRVCGE